MIIKQIRVFCNTDALYAAIQPEQNALTHDRCKVQITKHPTFVAFKLQAKDKTALKATLSGIAKLLTVYEKARRAYGKRN